MAETNKKKKGKWNTKQRLWISMLLFWKETCNCTKYNENIEHKIIHLIRLEFTWILQHHLQLFVMYWCVWIEAFLQMCVWRRCASSVPLWCETFATPVKQLPNATSTCLKDPEKLLFTFICLRVRKQTQPWHSHHEKTQEMGAVMGWL